MSNIAPLEGLLAINKPNGISSAQALRNIQSIFNKSPIFANTLQQEQEKREGESPNQRKKRKGKRGRPEVKIGHGGTLDPMATGVLVTGIGSATKSLQNFISCRKSYEAVALFGCSTDTYDAEGKILRRAPHHHITREAVEKALDTFRGEIMQKPPIYSALHHEGKRFYEYAREGKPLPIEIKARPVTVDLIELMDFTTDHTYKYPKEDASEEDKVVGRALQEQDERLGDAAAESEQKLDRAAKRSAAGGSGSDNEPSAKRRKPEDGETVATVEDNIDDFVTAGPCPTMLEEPRPVAIRIRMVVTSGFYVRSLVHDLGEALGSAAHMVKLVRTQQGQFELGKNVLEWDDLMSPDPSVWEGKVEETLRAWSTEQSKPKPHFDGRSNRKLEKSTGHGGGKRGDITVEKVEGSASASSHTV